MMRLGLWLQRHTASFSPTCSTQISRFSLMLLAWSHVAQAIQGIPFNPDNATSVKAAASNVAYNMMTYYTGNHSGDVPGNLPDPYYWWEAGAMFGSLINYYYYTGDSAYNDVVTQGMLWQTGLHNDFMTANQSLSTGNDDQGFWGLSAMAAAEQNFPSPPRDKPQWLDLARNVFNDQVARWDAYTCGGGLRWQIFLFNKGYTYKNSITNGVFFNLAARLAVHTQNDTYAQWAIKAWDWTVDIGFIDSDYYVYDGAQVTNQCTDINKVQWTYNVGTYLMGAAAMFNYTKGSSLWQDRTTSLINGTSIFFASSSNDVMYEAACEPYGTCDTDQFTFKAFLSRWMTTSIRFAPFVYPLVMPLLRASAVAAAQQCSGGRNGQMCGMKWTQGTQWDGTQGVGQQMAALEVIQSQLVHSHSGNYSTMSNYSITSNDSTTANYSTTSRLYDPPRRRAAH